MMYAGWHQALDACPLMNDLLCCVPQVTDSKLRKPVWGVAAGGNNAVFISIASWGSTILLGDSGGTLMTWDIATGRTTTTATEMGAIRRISVISVTSSNESKKARIALLSSSWQCGFWEIDSM